MHTSRGPSATTPQCSPLGQPSLPSHRISHDLSSLPAMPLYVTHSRPVSHGVVSEHAAWRAAGVVGGGFGGGVFGGGVLGQPARNIMNDTSRIGATRFVMAAVESRARWPGSRSPRR